MPVTLPTLQQLTWWLLLLLLLALCLLLLQLLDQPMTYIQDSGTTVTLQEPAQPTLRH